MLKEVIIDSVDVSGKVVKWKHHDTWGEGIDQAIITLTETVVNDVTLQTGKAVTIKRGFSTSTDEFVFEGQITNVQPEGSRFIVTCKGEMIEAIKASRTKSFDINIDTEAGVASEIFKNYVTHAGLSYSSASIESTGTDAANKIQEFIQNDEDDWTKMQELADGYNYSIRRKPSDGLVYFQPKGFNVYPTTLQVGVNIIGRLKWAEDGEDLCNKVIINGATVYDKIVETFAGPATTFTLDKTPEDMEVRIDRAGADTLQTRGQKDVGTLGTDFDYYVSEEQKTFTFNGDKSDVWVNYGAQVPMPVIVKNQTSINTYGGPNKTPHTKKFTLNDIKDVADAEKWARAYLSKYSTPFTQTEIPVTDTIIRGQVVQPGELIRVIDTQNSKDVEVFVREVIKEWPHSGDKLIVGDRIWKTTDWQVEQQKQIDRLFNALNKNQDILINLIDLDRTIRYERRYMQKNKRDVTGTDVLIYNHPTFGTWNTGKWNTDASLPAESTLAIVQYDHVYKEFFYDDTFDGTGSATWDTGNKRLDFTSGQTRTTDYIELGITHSYFKVEFGSLTGSVLVEITGDDSGTFQTVTLNTRTAFTSNDGTGVKLRITENNSSTARVEDTYDSYGQYDEPGIKITLEE